MLRRPRTYGPEPIADGELEAAGFWVFGYLGRILRLVPGLLRHLLQVYNNSLGFIQELIEWFVELSIFSKLLATGFGHTSSWTRLVLYRVYAHTGERLFHVSLNDRYLIVFAKLCGVLRGILKGLVIVSTRWVCQFVFVHWQWLDAPSLVALGRSKLLAHNHRVAGEGL